MKNKNFRSLISFILLVIITCAYVTLKDFDFTELLKHKIEQTTAQKQVASNTKTTDLGYPEWTYDE